LWKKYIKPDSRKENDGETALIPGANVIKRFSLLFITFCNKIECLSMGAATFSITTLNIKAFTKYDLGANAVGCLC